MSPQDRSDTAAGLAQYPPTLSVHEAGELLGIGRTTAYALARADDFPVPVLRVGSQYRIPTAPLLALLGITALPRTLPSTQR
jgi:excisionase family DNA binding protein